MKSSSSSIPDVCVCVCIRVWYVCVRARTVSQSVNQSLRQSVIESVGRPVRGNLEYDPDDEDSEAQLVARHNPVRRPVLPHLRARVCVCACVRARGCAETERKGVGVLEDPTPDMRVLLTRPQTPVVRMHVRARACTRVRVCRSSRRRVSLLLPKQWCSNGGAWQVCVRISVSERCGVHSVPRTMGSSSGQGSPAVTWKSVTNAVSNTCICVHKCAHTPTHRAREVGGTGCSEGGTP